MQLNVEKKRPAWLVDQGGNNLFHISHQDREKIMKTRPTPLIQGASDEQT